MDEPVLGFEQYCMDFEELAVPEYQPCAEEKLCDAKETCVPGESFSVCLDGDQSKDGKGHTFYFSTSIDTSMECGGYLMVICYDGLD